ncbi:MAG: ATP-binding protein [Bacteroidales bacterium]|jgi:two-component system nitrogen regulation sensor histidine kinase NtrY|nr:ATP-binding protein [Bacteroidales bacterium]
MVFNRFNIIVILICILIAITGIALVEVWTNADYRIGKLTLSIVWIALIVLLINYVNKTNRSLKQFLDSLRYSDYVNSDAASGKSFKELNFSFNEIIRYVRLAELKKESTHHYLRHLLDQMPTGIIATDKLGKIEIINRAGLQILEFDSLSNLSQLDDLQKDLSSEIKNLSASKKKVISIQTKSGLKSILFRHKEILISNKKIQVISFENIRAELEFEEELAWQKIFRVLTHEIMNSIAPIRSLTASVLKIFLHNEKAKSIKQLNDEEISFAVTGLKSINNRNNGLTNFVSDFKKLMRVPEPKKEQVEINQFFDDILPLLHELCIPKNILLNYNRLLKTRYFLIDKEQITQVVINIVKNAVEAILKGKGIININPNINSEQLYIAISDNGEGISKDVLSEIFIPFLTTKNEGSGIGLSLSRQIIRNHNGNVGITSEKNKGTKCELSFPLLENS